MAKENNTTSTNTIVGPNTVLTGNLSVSGSLLVYGTVIGDVTSEGLVRTAKDSLIKGTVEAREAIIDGNLDGKLHVEGRATLGGSARMVGEMKVGVLVIEEGAKFSGKCKMAGSKIDKIPDIGNGQSDKSAAIVAPEPVAGE